MAIATETQPEEKQPPYLETTSVDYLAQTMTKIQQLPEPLIREVNYFIDFIFVRQDHKRWQQWNHFYESLDLTESDFSDYLANLESYEERLARGEIQW
jgi:hypothetical protein